MHFLVALGLLAALVAFAFGEDAARAFVAVVLLAVAAFFALMVFAVLSGPA